MKLHKKLNKMFIVLMMCVSANFMYQNTSFELKVSNKKSGFFSTLGNFAQSSFNVVKMVRGVL